MAKRLRCYDKYGQTIDPKTINETCYVRATFTDYPAQCADGQGVLLTLIYGDGWRRQIFYSPHSDNQKAHTFERISATSDVEYSSWYEFARCFEPEVHELSLVNGATAEKSCVYYKTQENLVVGQLDLQTSAAAYQEVIVAALPEGFRPSRDTPFIVSSCARKGVVWEGTGWGRISPDGYIFIYQNIAWGWAQAQFSFVAAD